ncbi:cingulin-like isoform X8 [Symsagittifera roscoffensis]|uniref:cingulin-like isoform X8 n=1 Tax=Symsagittifera roscoffensis TaxID=84072 RepID=UPI00307C72FD
MPPKQSAKLSEVKPRGKNGLELGPPSERDRSQSRERRKKKTARLELVAEVPDEQELETTLDEAEEVDNKFRSEADALLEDIEQRKVARRNRMIQDKLDEINGRVETTLGNYEAAGAEEMGGAQFVKDMQELMEVATDAVKKRKYMRDVSVFIVGFTSACEQRLNILEQLDVFFKEQEKQPEIEHKMGETDFDSISKSVEEALEFAQGSMGKLGDLNKEIIVAVENAVTARERAKGNQRLKKQLDKAKEDIQQLTDKLVEVQAELDEKLQEMKRVQRQNEELKIHAERAKKLAEDLKVLDNVEDIREKALEVDMMKEELKSVQAELSQKDAIISGLQEEIQRLEEEKDAIREELLSVISVKQDTIEALEEKVRDMELEHAREMDALKAEHEEQMESARLQFEQQMQEERELMAQHSANLQSELDETKSQFEQLQAEAKTMSEELDLLKNKKVFTEDEIGPPFDIRDEESWSNVAEDELRARYNQYRKLAITHITQLEEKVESNKELEKQLSEKFYQMEKQWNAERQLLMEQAERSESGRKEAEAEAEQTLHQLETFLHDMEKLHKMRDYTRLEARHFRKLDEDMQDQYMKTLSPYAQEALRQQLNEGPGDANFAMQTEEVINEAKRGINGLRAGSRRSQRSAEAQIMMKSVRNMRRYHSSMTPFTVDSFFDLSEIEKADPMLSEYLRAYDFVHEFKSTVAFLFKNKAVDSVVTILDEIEFISFDQDENCFQQISEMQQQLIILLGEILGVLLRILFQNKLDHRTLQYFQKQLPDLVPRSLYAHMDDSVLSGGAELKRLQDEVAALKSDFESQRRELEDKIGKLESDYGANKEQLRQLMIRLEESENKLAEFEAQRSAILFTRMDAERNYRNLKKAIQYDKIDTDTFEKATHLIDKYTSLPGQRLMTMVKRYSAHCSMRLLEENIRRMTGNRGAHIQLIHNFEQFQHKRDSQWRAVSAGLAAQRQEAAEKLTKDLEQIEQQSSGSIFLIKPMFSYKAKLPWINIFPELRKKTDGSGKYLTEMELTDVSESKPPPQPPTTHQPHKKRLAALPPKVLDPQFVPEPPMGTDRPFLPMTNIYETESGYVNNEMTGAGLMAVDYTQVPTWKKMDSVAENVIEDNMLLSSPHHAWNTPKMLELDINRFMMDHNSIMSPVRTLGSSGRAKHPRSYLSVSRTIPQDALTPKARGKTQPDSPKLVLGSDGHQRLPPITNNS